jgi:hypothetical protein
MITFSVRRSEELIVLYTVDSFVNSLTGDVGSVYNSLTNDVASGWGSGTSFLGSLGDGVYGTLTCKSGCIAETR